MHVMYAGPPKNCRGWEKSHHEFAECRRLLQRAWRWRRRERHFIFSVHLLVLCCFCAGRQWCERALLMEATAKLALFPVSGVGLSSRIGGEKKTTSQAIVRTSGSGRQASGSR